MDDKGNGFPGGLYALIDDGLSPQVPLERKAAAALAGGARVLQLRLKRTADGLALEVLRQVLALGRAARALVLVNDRVDLALVAGADGVHLGDSDLPVEAARAVLGPRAHIGRTARSLVEVRAAYAAGADHVGVGPIFHTTTKVVPHALLGLEGLRAIVADSPLPVVAIAGITLENIGAVAQAGARAAAVGAGLLDAEDLTGRAADLSAAFERGRRALRSVPEHP